MDGKPLRRVFGREARDDVAVDLHHVQVRQALQQRPRERAEPRTDLDHVIARPGIDRRDDLRDDAGTVEKVLAEPLARYVRAGHAAAPTTPAMASATSMASNRLPGSARPVPARSSAVP